MNDRGSDSVFRAPSDGYTGAYQDHLLEQYKLYVDSAARISERRTSANNYLLTVNAFLLTLFGFASSITDDRIIQIIVPLAGLLVTITWAALILSYRNLNTVKFQVIHEIEQRLPLALYDREWQLAQSENGRFYRPLTNIEPWIPVIFGVLYLVLVIYGIINYFDLQEVATSVGELAP